MLLSHTHKFIFVKTRKTAGTSIEVDLSKFMSDEDIVTPIIPEEPGHIPRNFQWEDRKYSSKNNIKTETDRHPVLNGMLYDKDLKRRNALRAIEMIKEGATVKEAIKAFHTSHSSICEFCYKRTHRQDGRTIKKVQECIDLMNSGVKLKNALKRLNLGAWSFYRYRHFFL